MARAAGKMITAEDGSALAVLPMPKRESVRAITVDVNCELYAAARREMKKRKISMRKMVDWALSSYVVAHNPQEAERLGIKSA